MLHARGGRRKRIAYLYLKTENRYEKYKENRRRLKN